MKVLEVILNRLYVLTAIPAEQNCQYTLYELIKHKNRIRIKKRIRDCSLMDLKERHKNPFVIIIGGPGVISKGYSERDKSSASIISNSDEFLSVLEVGGEKEGRIIFMRMEQYKKVISNLDACGLQVISTRMNASKEFLEEVIESGKEFFNSSCSIKNMFRPTQESNTLNNLLIKKLLLPVLSVVLLILATNVFIQQDLRKKSEQQQYTLNRLQMNVTARNKQDVQLQQLRSKLSAPSRYSYAFLADRIAARIPEGVMLTSLSINPVAKKIQANKPILTDTGKIVICGMCPVASPISVFTDVLKALDFIVQLELVSLIRDRNNKYIFEIEIQI